MFEFRYEEFHLLIRLYLAIISVFNVFFIFLDVGQFVHFSLDLSVSTLPLFNLAKPTFQDAINAIVLYFKVADFGLIGMNLMLEILKFAKFDFLVGKPFLPLLNLIHFGP